MITYAYIYVYVWYTVNVYVVYLNICVISSSSRCFSILPTQVTVQAHLYAPKHGLLLLDIRSQGHHREMDFSRFFSKDHGTTFYSNVNLAKGIVPYCVVQMLSQSWFTSSNFLIPAEIIWMNMLSFIAN